MVPNLLGHIGKVLITARQTSPVIDIFPVPQAYIPKRRTLIQVLPPANAYTKYAHAYI